MQQVQQADSGSATKAATGIAGFDQMTGGGLPRGRTTLLVGGPGCGKTIFALHFLEHGAGVCGETGVFVAFEETPERLLANAAGFGWRLDALNESGQLHFLDAQPPTDIVQAGSFDLGGMLAVLGTQASRLGARRIVFDALDIVLERLPDDAARRHEMQRLHAWLLDSRLTAFVTLKSGSVNASDTVLPAYGFMQYMVDCVVLLDHRVVRGVSERHVRVQKYRASGFDENETPFVIGQHGIEVAVTRPLGPTDVAVSSERVTSGVDRLDTMLGGGYYRAACVLISGFPGTAKTTLGGAFAEAACLRGEPTVFVTFDSEGNEVVRNLNSVGIRLERFVDSGLLRMASTRTVNGSPETSFVRIKRLVEDHAARCLVIDPVSTLSAPGNRARANSVAERLIGWSKARGITLVCTSLLDQMVEEADDGASLQISALADTWIHLSYLVQAGERNRGMSIIKSRGTAHSNQVRELVLSDHGVTLADVYTAGGEVLMGTMRWEKESAERVAGELGEVAGQLKKVTLDAEEAELEVRLKSLQTELVAKQVEKTLLGRTTESREYALSRGRTRMQELRGGDADPSRRK